MTPAFERGIVAGAALCGVTGDIWDALDGPAAARCRAAWRALRALPREKRAARLAAELIDSRDPARRAASLPPERLAARLRDLPEDLRRIAAGVLAGAAGSDLAVHLACAILAEAEADGAPEAGAAGPP